MDLINAVVLGIIEGLTEFLPVSSTGHLILTEYLFSFQDKAFAESFMVIIQSGAILAVLIYFWRRFWPFGHKGQLEQQNNIRALWVRTIIGTLPFIILAFLFHKQVKSLLFHPIPVAIALIFWGVVIIIVENVVKNRNAKGQKSQEGKPENLSIKQTLLIGLFQCLAIVPGTSRSAATIIGSMLLGVNRVAATEFSFFLALPALLGAGAYELISSKLAFTANQFLLLGIGIIVSFVVAYAVVAFFMNFIRKYSFILFGWYRIGLGIIVISLYLVFLK